MSWAATHVAALARDLTITFRPRGHSMRGRISDGQPVTVAPLGEADTIAQDDIVLCRVHGRDFLHLVLATRREGPDTRYLIGNNRGRINGWIGRAAVFGRVTEIHPTAVTRTRARTPPARRRSSKDPSPG